MHSMMERWTKENIFLVELNASSSFIVLKVSRPWKKPYEGTGNYFKLHASPLNYLAIFGPWSWENCVLMYNKSQ